MDYFHGGDIYSEDIAYDFSVNTNPLGMPEESLKAAKEAIGLSGQYPDYSCRKLCESIAYTDGANSESIVSGNGSTQLLHLVCQCLNVKNALTLAPSFYEYERAVRLAGGKMHFYETAEENSFRAGEGFIDAIEDGTDLVFICNPGNPDGNLYGKDYIRKIAEKCRDKNAYLCIDECFLPFCYEEDDISFRKDIYKYENVIVLRAFTKIYAMAGLRLGYLLCADTGLVKRIKENMPLWSVCLPAQSAGAEALKDHGYIQQTRKLVQSERKYLTDELEALSYKVYESHANFILFRADPGLYDFLLENRILIRNCKDFRGLDDSFYRTAVKKHEDNEILIDYLRKFREV